MPAILSTSRSAETGIRRCRELPLASQCRCRVRHTADVQRLAKERTRCVRMQSAAWHFPLLDLVPGAVSGAGDASDAVAGAVTAAASSGIPTELLAAGAGVAALVVGLGAVASGKKDSPGASGSQTSTRSAPASRSLVRENCVLVVGASGRSGQACVKALLASGRSVVAACRSAADLGVQAGEQENGAALFVEKGVDVTRPGTIKKGIFQGVTQVVITSAATPGNAGFNKGNDPESVDADGVEAVVKRATEFMAASATERSQQSFIEATDFATWECKDDTVMGGTSSSAMAPVEGSSVAEWKGELVVEGGGFCGVSSSQSYDLSAYDGISLRVKGGGETYKINLKNPSQEDKPLEVYQATFDTVAGDWVNVSIPWHEFVPVSKADVKYDAAPLDTAKISTVGLVYSRFDYNGYPNPNHKPGAFSLEIEGGMSGYTEPRPTIIQVSSASTERNALIGDDVAARAADIPIVQLNPSGVMNWKYKGECAVRGSGLAYSVLRPTGLVGDTDPDEGKAYALELSQGDMIAGRVSREDLAAVVVQACAEPAAVNSTYEIKRTERWGLGGEVMFNGQVPKSEWLRLVQDRDRRKAGLTPTPAFAPPPEPVSEERKQEILADPRVVVPVAAGEAEAVSAGAVPLAQGGPAEAAIALRKVAVGQWIADYRGRTPAAAAEEAAPAEVAAPAVDKGTAAEIAQRKKEAQAWIAAWRSAPPPAPVASSNGAAAAPAAPVVSSKSDIAARKKEAQEWIENWRAQTPSPQDEVRAWIANWRAGSTAQNGSKKAVAKVKVGAR